MKIINSLQDVILQNFGKCPGSNQFYLTGGTALALFYLRHRKSNDLDFFTSVGEAILPFSEDLEKNLKTFGQVRRQRAAFSFVELFIEQEEEKTLIHLAQDSAFRFERTRQFPEYPGLAVDNLSDISSNKLLALFGRAALRDFIDIFFLVKRAGLSPETLIQQAKQKDPGFDLYWLGVALERVHTFEENSSEWLMLLEPISFLEFKSFFNDWRQKILEKIDNKR